MESTVQEGQENTFVDGTLMFTNFLELLSNLQQNVLDVLEQFSVDS